MVVLVICWRPWFYCHWSFHLWVPSVSLCSLPSVSPCHGLCLHLSVGPLPGYLRLQQPVIRKCSLCGNYKLSIFSNLAISTFRHFCKHLLLLNDFYRCVCMFSTFEKSRFLFSWDASMMIEGSEHLDKSIKCSWARWVLKNEPFFV